MSIYDRILLMVAQFLAKMEKKGTDINLDLQVTLEEVFLGTTIEVRHEWKCHLAKINPSHGTY